MPIRPTVRVTPLVSATSSAAGVTRMVCRPSARPTTRVTSWSARSLIRSTRSVHCEIGSPSKATIVSPTANPARSAGRVGTTPEITAGQSGRSARKAAIRASVSASETAIVVPSASSIREVGSVVVSQRRCRSSQVATASPSKPTMRPPATRASSPAPLGKAAVSTEAIRPRGVTGMPLIARMPV
ncbi:MAG: hypothetical protein R2909_07095 [Gemmatimonadales bacterium]